MKIKKDYLLAAGFFVASFIVINIGMFFFLKMTQPKMGARRTEAIAKMKGADSTKVQLAALKKDSAQAKESPETMPSTVPTDSQLAATPVSATSGHESMATAVPANPAAETAEPKKENVEDVSALKTETLQTGSATDSTKNLNSGGEVLTTAGTPPGDIKEMAKLAKLLDTMKPDEAAAIASRLETDQIIALVMRMKDRNGGKMLAALPVEISSKIAAEMSLMATRARVKS